MKRRALKKNRFAARAAFLIVVFTALFVGCSKDKTQIECPEEAPAAQKDVKVERTLLGTAGVDKSSADWCRACVMGPKGFASCQRVYAETKEETRDSIRARAKDKACLDAGFKKGECPDQAVILATCKGDPRPEQIPKPGKALQDLFMGKPKEAPPAQK